ncbi:hypothetical protein P1P68_34080 [Streptomyces scabiei]|uniref:hypothetical protein n=1 Tax=Streptomyces scabiei TaxID=1930 RepID=UPI00298F7BC2|nr:hypothetical protein [Streptomyces scabiei]MDW8809697.1 hypothetical protein [Streptomyces scabiei]
MDHLNGTPAPAPGRGPVPGRASAPRLLPWPSPEGKPSYLVTDHHGGYLSRLADDLEASQLATGTDVLGLARTVLDDPTSPYTEVRYAGIRLAECLTDALRVAESRGLRLPEPDFEDDEGAEVAEVADDAGRGKSS